MSPPVGDTLTFGVLVSTSDGDDLPPHEVHSGLASETRARRAAILDAAFLAHPERFTRGQPEPPPLPTEVWINKPEPRGSMDHAAQ